MKPADIAKPAQQNSAQQRPPQNWSGWSKDAIKVAGTDIRGNAIIRPEGAKGRDIRGNWVMQGGGLVSKDGKVIQQSVKLTDEQKDAGGRLIRGIDGKTRISYGTLDGKPRSNTLDGKPRSNTLDGKPRSNTLGGRDRSALRVQTPTQQSVVGNADSVEHRRKKKPRSISVSG